MALRAAALASRCRLGRYTLLLGVTLSFAGGYVLAALVHELIVLGIAFLLPLITSVPAIQDAIAALPVNFIYASAMVRYAGQIEASGLAIAGDPGVALANAWPAALLDPSFVAGEGFISAVLAPGSSLLARTLVATIANAMVLVAGVVLAVSALRDLRIAVLAQLRGTRLCLLAAGLAVQIEVAARVVRAPGASRDLETLGLLPFLLHEVLRLPREFYDAVMYQLSRFLDPVFGEVVLLALLGSLVLVYVAGRAALIGCRRVGQRLYLLGPAPLPSPILPQRLVIESALVAVLVATLPLWDFVSPESRFLEWEPTDAGVPMVAERLTGADGGALPVDPAIDSVKDTAPAGLDIVVPAADRPALKADVDAVSSRLAPAVRQPVLPPIVRPTYVGIGGRGGNFSYVVDGLPTEFRGMGLNVTYAGLPSAERAERLARDFGLMRQIGVNVVVGWRTGEWDEAVLDAAQAAGIGVVMPFDLDDKLDYSDRGVRWRVRTDVLAWIARYRSHPAIRMWGIGNETLLHLKQPARARAFAEFYTGLVDLVRQFDPDHPVLYREAEDVYVRWLQDAWAPRGGPPPGFVLGMNFYTFRMRDALNAWPKRGWDVPLIVSEFAPAGLGRGERAAGYWKMWNIIRAQPEMVLGAAPYVWNAEGPEPVDRLFGVVADGKPVDSTLGTLRDLYHAAALPKDEAAPVAVPPLVGLPESVAAKVIEHLGLRVGAVTHQRAADLGDPLPVRRYGVGNVIYQEPAPGTPVERGGEVRIAVGDASPDPTFQSRSVAS